MKVIKRNNTIVDYDLNKITTAISKAMKECGVDDREMLCDISDLVEKEIQENYEEFITIEDIQDIVENQLMKVGLTDIAKAYILYRDNRRKVREEQAKLYEEAQQKIKNIMEMKDIENSNANVDEGSFSGKNSKVTSHFLKEYALNNLMDKEVAKAHREGRLYTHDLDNYCSGMSNCLNIDFQDLFENNKGFKTRNGDVRKPNDIMTFFQLVAVVFQCESQVL